MASRVATCPACGVQFAFEIGRGKDRKYCGDRCLSVALASRRKERALLCRECSVDGCSNRVRSAESAHCEKHYMRNRRRGSLRLALEDKPPPAESIHSHGYVLEYLPDHPLWPETHGRLYQHRRVFFDHHGKGPFDCNWCGSQVEWSGMHVDHVNAVRNDNRIGNLVPSCPKCNVRRGAAKSMEKNRKRSTLRIEWRGESLCLAEWAERLGISSTSIKWRIGQGWPVERIVSEPRGKFGPKSKAAKA